MRLGALIPAGFLLGALLCAHLLARPPHAIATDLVQPLAVVTYWKAFGAQLFAVLLLSMAIATVGYVAVLREFWARRVRPPGAYAERSRSDRLRMTRRVLGMTMALSAASCAAAMTWPAIFSSDVYAYAGYGDLALHGISPYAHARITLHDPLLDAMVWQWGNPPPMCVYGPAFVAIAQGIVALLSPLGAAAPLWGFRALSSLALVACAPLAYAAFRRSSNDVRLAAAAGIALNPMAVWACADGHNDALLLAIVLAGFALVQWPRSWPRTGAAIIALASLIKAPALGASAAMLLAAWHDRARFGKLLAGTAIGTAAALAIAVPLEYGVRTHLVTGGKYLPQFSIQYVLAAFIPLWAALAITALAGAALAFAGARRLAASKPDGAVFLAFAVWLLVPNPYPWYAIWIVPIAFLAWDTLAARAVLAASLLMVFRYYPDASYAAFPVREGVAVTLLEYGIPMLLLTAYILDLVRRDRPANHRQDPDFARLHSE